eukprot:gene12702-17034_t
MDAIKILEDDEDHIWICTMRNHGYSEGEIVQMKNVKDLKEKIWVCKEMIKLKLWDNGDVSCNRTDCYIALSTSYEELNRRYDAIEVLRSGHKLYPHDSTITLALAKITFKDDKKEESLHLCQQIFSLYSQQLQSNLRDDEFYFADESNYKISEEEVGEAYYLGGWVKIHDDDHTNAYKIWQDGYNSLPDNFLLKQQNNKRSCWDNKDLLKDDENWLAAACYLGGAHNLTSNDQKSSHDMIETTPCDQMFILERLKKIHFFDVSTDLDCFRCYEECHDNLINGNTQASVPALGLFDKSQHEKGIVFRTRSPLLTPMECKSVIDEVYSYHAQYLDNKWGTVRHSSVKTTDIAVESIPKLRFWLIALMHTRLERVIEACFPLLADGTTLRHNNDNEDVRSSRIRIHDAFIVRYDSIIDQSLSLPEHCDTSAVSVVLSLNSEVDGDYVGGGTWFEALGENGMVVNAPIGCAVVFAGPLKHAGFPIIDGIRHILVLFLYVEDFHYGPLLNKTLFSSNSIIKNSVEESKEESSNITKTSGETTDTAEHEEAAATHNKSKEDSQVLASGGKKGGFVVYRQTVDLVNMLNRKMIND